MKFVADGLDANTNQEKHVIDSKMIEKLQDLTLDDSTQPETVEVQQIYIRKTPKFPSRERHKAIRRKIKPISPCANGKMFSFVGGYGGGGGEM